MWYRLKLAVADVGKKPLIRDGQVYQGDDLVNVLSDAASDLATATGLLRGTEVPYLEGYLSGGLELEVWASYESFKESDRAAEAYRQSTRLSVLDAHSCGHCSPRPPTRMVPPGCLPS